MVGIDPNAPQLRLISLDAPNLTTEEMRGVLKTFLENVLKDTVVYTTYAQRKVCS